jgi:large subunit ribosomal protein L4
VKQKQRFTSVIEIESRRRYPAEKKKTMAKIDVVNLNGETVGSMELADALFGADQVNEGLLWEAVKHYRASLRQGTHKTKSRTEVAGSGKKLWKQKGTGRARIGSVRSPLWRHGYTVHGPQPRSYDYAFPRKKLLGALRSALASKLADGKLTVVDTLELKDAKTKLYRAALDKLNVTRTALIVENSKTLSQSLLLGARNLEGVELVLNNEVHPYDLLRYERAIFSTAALEQLTEMLEKNAGKRHLAAAGLATQKEAI